MTQYRIYRRGANGGTQGLPFLISCNDDATALARASQHNDGNGVAVWDGARLVGVILVGL
jgi:hypothetical protein